MFCTVLLWEHHVTFKISNSLVFTRRCYGHNWYNDYNRKCEGKLVKTHVETLKRGEFLRLENFGVRSRSDYDKRDSDWSIDISTATKVYEIPPFDPPIKLFFHVSDTIRSFARRMLQPFVTSTLVVTVIGMRGEVDENFELLVADEDDAEDIQVVSTSTTLFSLLLF